MFAPAFALGAVAFLVAGVVAAVSATSAEREVVAHSSGPTLTLPNAPADDLVLYAALPDGSAPSDDLLCRLDTQGQSRAGYSIGTGTFEVDGRTLHQTGEVDSGWQPGDTVTCDGVSHLAAVAGGGAGPRLALAGMLLFGALLATILAVTGRRSARQRRGSVAT